MSTIPYPMPCSRFKLCCEASQRATTTPEVVNEESPSEEDAWADTVDDERENMTTSACVSKAVSIPMDTVTRWGSSYAMFKRALELRGAVEMFCTHADCPANIEVTRAQWSLMKVLNDKLLAPLAAACKMAEGDAYPTSGLAVPL